MVGVCSYLLVSFWFTRIAANQSSISAFLANRVGDCFLTIGMFVILWCLGNLEYGTVFSVASYINGNEVIIIGACLLIGAMAKSSQVGLHVWLPMAMEGPTPVSALIHAATMVTAGVYLLMRSSPVIEYSAFVLALCLWLGTTTTVFSSLIGLFQQDIKKIIAYSTMSQLGMMVLAIGLSCYSLALFHLINHAFYKALLFLGAGSVIHAVADNQDLRKYGGMIDYLPLTYSVMLIASLSLVAFPFMTGFYSKDFILESALGQSSFAGTAGYIIATIGAVFTTLYSVKVLYLTFLSNPNGSMAYYRIAIDYFNKIKNYKPAHEGDFFLTSTLILLALFSIFFGFITKDMFIGIGSNLFADNSLFIHPIHEIMIDTEFAVPVLLKLLPFIFTMSFGLIALTLSESLFELVVYFKLSRIGYTIYGFFNQRFLIEFFYNKYITNLIFILGGQITKMLDKGSIEHFGPYGLEKGVVKSSKNISYLSTSHVTNYALYFLIAFVIDLFYFILYLKLILIIILLLLMTSYNKECTETSFSNINYKNHINYKNGNKRMFSTSATLLNKDSSDNNSESSKSDSDSDSDSPEAKNWKKMYTTAKEEREGLKDDYRKLNNDHSECQDRYDDDHPATEKALKKLEEKTEALKAKDFEVKQAKEGYSKASGKELPDSEDEWDNTLPLERGREEHYEKHNLIQNNSSGEDNVGDSSDENSSNNSESSSSSGKDESKNDDNNNSLNNKRSRSDTLEQMTQKNTSSKHQKTDNNDDIMEDSDGENDADSESEDSDNNNNENSNNDNNVSGDSNKDNENSNEDSGVGKKVVNIIDSIIRNLDE